MTKKEAMDIVSCFYGLQIPAEEEAHYIEALEYLIRETKQSEYMLELGGFYYEKKQFDLALKYYEMAAADHNPDAYNCLGYIWYYGRTGERDYEKAYQYYEKAAQAGNIQAAYKIADMYKNGYYVEKDYARYCEIIEDLYLQMKDLEYVEGPLPEIYTRLARIRMEQEKYDEAEDLLLQAKEFLAYRIEDRAFFGDLNSMKWLMEDLYRLPPKIEPMELDLYNLFVVLQQPALVRFRYQDQIYKIWAVKENDECVIRFEDHWYRTVEDFFAKAQLNGHPLTSLYAELTGWEVLSVDH